MKNVLERLINLLAMLLTASRPVSAEEIRRTIPGYSMDSDEAFHRMFERDKDLLRSIGVPVEMRATDGWEVEQGYVVDPDKYRLPDPGLNDEERAALFLAAQMVRLGGEPAGPDAVLKLGGARLTGAVEPLAADLGATVDVLAALFQAVSEKSVVVFAYKGYQRRIAPYGLGHRRGHWYLVGGTSSGERMYRVDRIEKLEIEEATNSFERPSDFKLTASLASLPWEAGGDDTVQARVRFNEEVAWWAARQLGGKAAKPAKDGSMTVSISVANREAFLGWVLSFGDGAEVLGPTELRDALIARVRGVA